jgi:hypothetical protein
MENEEITYPEGFIDELKSVVNKYIYSIDIVANREMIVNDVIDTCKKYGTVDNINTGTLPDFELTIFNFYAYMKNYIVKIDFRDVEHLISVSIK